MDELIMKISDRTFSLEEIPYTITTHTYENDSLK